jgi:hypothetical protein
VTAAFLLPFLLTWLAAPFWETKAPEQWDDRELEQLLTDSPWAQMVTGAGKSGAGDPVQLFFATAGPIQSAEKELDRRAALRKRSKQPGEPDPLVEEYREWLAVNQAGYTVIAIRIPNTAAFSDQREIGRMEEESFLQVGRKKIKMSGHFPPSSSDPYLRLAFPRPEEVSAKFIVVDLYLPGISIPYRQAQFSVKDMAVHGKLAY